MPTTFTGTLTVLLNLQRHTTRMATGASNGLRVAGAMLLRESQQLTPVEFGNLRASGYVHARGSGFSTEVEVGYTASYALYVHEQVQMKLRGQARRPSPPRQGRYWDPQGRAQAKFLEAPARNLQSQMLAIVRRYATI